MYGSPKRQYLRASLYGVRTRNSNVVIPSAVKISNLACYNFVESDLTQRLMPSRLGLLVSSRVANWQLQTAARV
jgi:hypothetical protein